MFDISRHDMISLQQLFTIILISTYIYTVGTTKAITITIS